MTHLNDTKILQVRRRNKPKGPVDAWVLVNSEVQDGGQVQDSALSLHFRVITPTRYEENSNDTGVFYASYSPAHNVVSLTSSVPLSRGGILLGHTERTKGNRIGTYLMDRIVAWVEQWPDAKINKITLAEIDGSDQNKTRRNRFYEQFGIRFEYRDDSKREGTSIEMKACQLVRSRSWQENIDEKNVKDHLQSVFSDLTATQNDLLRAKERYNYLESQFDAAKKRPLRWALKMTIRRTSPYILLAFIAPIFVYTFLH